MGGQKKNREHFKKKKLWHKGKKPYYYSGGSGELEEVE